MYNPPVKDMAFCLRYVNGVSELPQIKAGELDDEMIEAILTEAGRLASEELAPLNASGDQQGCTLQNGEVTTPEGYKEFYAKYRDNGWNGVPFNPDFGGQGLPWALAFGVQEMWQSASVGFGLCPLLNQAAVEAIEYHGTDEQKRIYLEKLISGQWTGTMNLTEPHAGTDLGAIKARAEIQPDGTYKITGQKIFITYGEHDFAENIIHTVLARTTGAPEGIKGISMFIVPKFIPDENGNPGERNDFICAGIEHKLGIHASPTCTMQFGDNGGATGYLIGAENEGIKYMFTMMNNARLAVGLQGVAVSERATQHAIAYANERVQGTALGDKSGARVTISHHPDVQRMLLSMKALTEAGRALTYEAALALDLARDGDKEAQAKVDILTPIVKAWCTDCSVEVASTGIQVHGGMGFIEETGAAQYYRDARILPIYEGANGVQALDLHGRKLLRDKGQAVNAFITGIESELAEIKTGADDSVLRLCGFMDEAVVDLKDATHRMLSLDLVRGAAVNKPYLDLFGTVMGGLMMLRAAASLHAVTDSSFREAKQSTIGFYMTHILPRAKGFHATIKTGSDDVGAVAL